MIGTHLLFTVLLAVAFGIIVIFGRSFLNNYFEVSPNLINLSNKYLLIGAFALLSQSAVSVLNTALIAFDKRKLTLVLLALIISGKVLVALIATKLSSLEIIGSNYAFLTMGCSTLFLNLVAAYFTLKYLNIDFKSIIFNIIPNFQSICSVWLSEIGIASIRAITPTLYSFQLARILSPENFFVTFQMTTSLAYALCLPYLSSVQIALRDASLDYSKNSTKLWGNWISGFLYLAFFPTMLLLLGGAMAPSSLYKLFLNFELPHDHTAFVRLYFFGCMVGQVGNLFVVPLRALKQNWVVTRNFFITELVIQIGGAQILIFSGNAYPTNFGIITIVFCTSHLLINFLSLTKSRQRALC